MPTLPRPHSRLVAVGGASNGLGTINDVARVTSAARAVGALTFVDAVHYAPHELIDVEQLGCDFLACSPYKYWGPHAGLLYGRAEVMGELLRPFKVRTASNTLRE